MSGVEPNVGAATKALEVLKDLPLWLLAGLVVAAGTLLWVPWFAAALPANFRPWVLIGESYSASWHWRGPARCCSKRYQRGERCAMGGAAFI